MNKPITSRIQHATDKGMVRQPLLNMGSPVKQTDVELENKAKETIEQVDSYQEGKLGVRTNRTRVEPGDLVKGGEITRNKSWDDLRKEGWSEEKINKAKAWSKDNPDAPRIQVGTGEFKDDTYKPGKTTTTTSFDSYKVALKGDAKKPWHRRQDMRSTKLSTRGVIKTQDKIDKLNRKKDKLVKKYDTFDKDGKKDGKLDKAEMSKVKSKGFLGIGNDARSLSRTENRIKAYGGQLKGAQGSQNASIKQQEQSVRYGNKIDLGERDARLSDAGGFDKQREVLASSTAKMKSSPYKMAPKSPVAKKLQGNQGRLPQHLQDAIKAAPESPAKLDPMTMMMLVNAVKGKKK